jgi:hypothetical protein
MNWTHEAAFAFYGTKATNIRYSWTAIDERKPIAVITAWQDGFTNKDGKPMYHRVHQSRGNGYRELVKHVKFAQDHCDGEMHVILAGAVDPQKTPRQIGWCEPREGIKLKIASFDAATGELWANVV